MLGSLHLGKWCYLDTGSISETEEGRKDLYQCRVCSSAQLTPGLEECLSGDSARVCVCVCVCVCVSPFCVHLVPALCGGVFVCVCVSVLYVLGTHSVRVGVCVCVCLRLCALGTRSVCVCACVSISIYSPAFCSASAQALYHLRPLNRLSENF